MEAQIADLFWLSDERWAVVGRIVPTNQPGARRLDDRRVVTGILHILRTGGRWRDVLAEYGPATTVYNRFDRWSRRGFWRAMLAALAKAGSGIALVSWLLLTLRGWRLIDSGR